MMRNRVLQSLIPGASQLLLISSLCLGQVSCSDRQPSSTEDAVGRRTAAPGGAESAIEFVDGTTAAGIDVHHHPGRSDQRYLPETMGAGLLCIDFNSDGAPDLLVLDSGDPTRAERPSQARNRLLLNDGQGHFTDRTKDWNLPSLGYGMGAAAGDFDGDGWTDLYLTHFGGNDRFLRNTGDSFEDVTDLTGLEPDGSWSSSAGFFDLEGDGDLDLWVCRYLDYQIEDAVPCHLLGVHHYCSPHLFDGIADGLFRNEGNGRFVDVSEELGLPSHIGKGLAVLLADVDGDGTTDVYTANDVTGNHLFLNDGNGGLHESGLLSGVAFNESGKAEAGMGVDLTDLDGDLLPDLVCTNFQGETNNIFSQIAPGQFRDISDQIGVGRSSRARLGFGVDFFDADNDGDEDLLIANGHVDDNVEAQTPTVTFPQQNLLFEMRDGQFVDVSGHSGPALLDIQVSRGLAVSDLDADGDMDFLVANNGGQIVCGRNETPSLGSFVNLWLVGTETNRNAIGTRVLARVGHRTLMRQIVGASSYLGTQDFRIHFGLGSYDVIDELIVEWAYGEPQTFIGLPAGAFYRIEQGEEPETYVPGQR